jgi:hypothetical protein
MQTYNKTSSSFTKGDISLLPISVLAEIKKIIGYQNFQYKECFEEKNGCIIVYTNERKLFIYPSTKKVVAEMPSVKVSKWIAKVEQYLITFENTLEDEVSNSL